jgi:hypothetical protein
MPNPVIVDYQLKDNTLKSKKDLSITTIKKTPRIFARGVAYVIYFITVAQLLVLS